MPFGSPESCAKPAAHVDPACSHRASLLVVTSATLIMSKICQIAGRYVGCPPPSPPFLLSALHIGFYRRPSVGSNGPQGLSTDDTPVASVHVPPRLFLNERRLIPPLTQAKAQVLYLLLSHRVGQWIKPLRVSTAAPRSSEGNLFARQSITHMLTWGDASVRGQYLQMSSVGFRVL